VAWIFGQRPKRQKHDSACSVTFAKANNLVARGVLTVRRSASEMKRNAEIDLLTKSSKLKLTSDGPHVTCCRPNEAAHRHANHLTFMKRETRQAWRELAFFSSLGFSVALSVFIGLGIGVFLDRYFDTSPWLLLVFLVLGIAAGFRNIGLAIKKSRKL
jgi:ATP synthase protein I